MRLSMKLLSRSRLFVLGLVAVLIIATPVSLLSIYAQQENTLETQLKIAFTSNLEGNDEIYVIPEDASRAPVNLTRNPAHDIDPAWSPDGAQIVFVSDRDGADSLFTMNQNGSRQTRLIQDGVIANDTAPAWSPDGAQIVFVSDRAGVGLDLYLITGDGSGLTQITRNQLLKGDPAWSPDGLSLVYWERQVNGEIHLFRLTVASGSIARLSFRGLNNGMPAWAPDSSLIYFDSDRDGEWGIYSADPVGNNPERLTPFEINSGRAAVSPTGERIVFVSDRDDSDELYVMDADGTSVERLTEDLDADFGPAWQPAIPIDTPPIVEVETSLLPTPTPDPDAISVDSSVFNIDTSPITLDRMLVDYGIRAWHDAGWKGDNQRIGVLDTGFGGLTALEQQFGIEINTPSNTTVETYAGDLNDHGTQVLEIIHIVAPGAALYVCDYNGVFAEFEACVDFFLAADVGVINHSAGVPALPLNGLNAWAARATDAYTRGPLWVNAAGNFNRGFIADNFRDADQDNIHEFATGQTVRQELRVTEIGELDDQGNPIVYRGSIILSWQKTPLQSVDAQGNSRGSQADLDLEIFDLANPNRILAAGNRPQRDNPTDDALEFVNVSADVPFGIRVVNRGQPIVTPIEFLLFAEFISFDGAEIRGSVIAPADAEDVLTVGAVQGITNTLAVYSSRGVRSTNDWDKPDLSAPGELILTDGRQFVGTSAAAPVIAGVAALVAEQNPIQYDFSDALRGFLLTSVTAADSDSYGAGVFLLLQPPSRDLSELLVAKVIIEPKVTFPQPEVAVATPEPLCAGAWPERLAIGAQGYVNYNLGLFLRSEPRSQSNQLATLELGDEFTVIGGPECTAPLNWWQIQVESGATGWVAEGEDYYLIAPINLERAVTPLETEDCTFAPPTLFEIGDRAITDNVPSGFTLWRSPDLQYTVGVVGNGTRVHILGGPFCNDELNVRRWYIRVLDGRWAGNEGVMSEHNTEERWLYETQ